jgi:hypothetical protein
MVIRAMLMKPDRRDQMASLPLEDGPEAQTPKL